MLLRYCIFLVTLFLQTYHMKRISKLPILLAFLALYSSQNIIAQSYNSFYGDIVNNCSYDSINQNLIDFENLGIKESGTAALTNTLNWLIDKYQQYGYTDIVLDTFDYNGNEAYNLIVTKPGTTYPNTFVVVDGHYDTKTGTGTNDNGSGISIILETARLLQNINTEYSIKFINFSMEEVGLVGSAHYVNNVVIPQNLNIKIVFNIDEVGGVKGLVNNIITCERDENPVPSTNNVASANYTDTLVTCVQLYSSLNTEISYAYGSDYVPFQSKDYVITGLFEKNETPHRHTATDSIAYVDISYVFEIAKGTVGASLYYAVAYDTVNSINEIQQKDFVLYPNPATDFITVKFNPEKNSKGNLKIVNLLGEVVYQNNINEPTTIISLNHFTSGIYHLIVETDKFIQTQKFMVR